MNNNKFEVRFGRASAHRLSGGQVFNTKEQGEHYTYHYTPKEKKDLEEWGLGESAVLKLKKVQNNEQGMVTDRKVLDSKHVEEQDILG